jgi:hypothetical protein
MGNIKKKKVGVAGLKPTLNSLDYRKLSNQNLHHFLHR